MTVWSYDHMIIWPYDHMIIWSYGHAILRSCDRMIRIWSYGHMVIWTYDHMTVWSYDHMIIWSFNHMIIWSYGSYDRMIIWSYGHMIIWSYDRMIMWSYEHFEACRVARIYFANQAGSEYIVCDRCPAQAAPHLRSTQWDTPDQTPISMGRSNHQRRRWRLQQYADGFRQRAHQDLLQTSSAEQSDLLQPCLVTPLHEPRSGNTAARLWKSRTPWAKMATDSFGIYIYIYVCFL